MTIREIPPQEFLYNRIERLLTAVRQSGCAAPVYATIPRYFIFVGAYSLVNWNSSKQIFSVHKPFCFKEGFLFWIEVCGEIIEVHYNGGGLDSSACIRLRGSDKLVAEALSDEPVRLYVDTQ